MVLARLGGICEELATALVDTLLRHGLCAVLLKLCVAVSDSLEMVNQLCR